MCKFKAHKRCAVRATNNCKWTTLASIGKDIIEDEDGVSTIHIYSIFQSCFFFTGKRKKKRLSIEIVPCDPLKLMVGGYTPEHFSKFNVIFRTKVIFLSHKTSLVSVGTKIAAVLQDFKGHMQRNSEAGELLPEVPTALKRRWYFMLLPCCGNLFCVLLTNSCSPGGLFGIH